MEPCESPASLASPPFGSAAAIRSREMDDAIMRPPIIVEVGRPAQRPADGHPRVAIVVERDPDLRNTLTDYLLSRDHQVLALDATPHPDDVRRLQPNLLVLDLLCDGEPTPVETIRRFRSSLIDSCFVALSADAHLSSTYADEIVPLVSGVLVKPFDLDHFDDVAGLDPF